MIAQLLDCNLCVERGYRQGGISGTSEIPDVTPKIGMAEKYLPVLPTLSATTATLTDHGWYVSRYPDWTQTQVPTDLALSLSLQLGGVSEATS